MPLSPVFRWPPQLKANEPPAELPVPPPIFVVAERMDRPEIDRSER